MMSSLFGALGMLATSFLLILLGRLSQRLGRVTRAKASYIWFYVASALVFVGAALRAAVAFNLQNPEDLTQSVFWILLYNGMPALGLTLGLIVAWRYWSWLLAERS